MSSITLSSAECSTWYAVSLTTAVAVVAVNLLSIILFVKNSNLRTRAMYLVINLTVADMFVGGSATFFEVFFSSSTVAKLLIYFSSLLLSGNINCYLFCLCLP